MSYPLKQNPVPLWAAPEQQSVTINPQTIPGFLIHGAVEDIIDAQQLNTNNDEPHSGGNGNSDIQSSSFLKHIGRWNGKELSFLDIEQAATQNVQDPSILDSYNLRGEWESKLEDTFQRPALPNIWQRMKANFIKNLAANPFYPMILRGSASAFLIIALALSCAVLVKTNNARHQAQETMAPLNVPAGPAASTIFSIVTCCISLVYMIVSLYDETFGRPLGLRPTQTKLHFVTIDLCLICFTAANLAVAFDSLVSKKYICPGLVFRQTCRLQRTCTAFIFLALVVWFLSFLVSVFRMLDRAAH